MLIDFGLIFIIATIPLIFAAVQPHVWSGYAGIILIIFSLSIWKNNFTAYPQKNKFLCSLIITFFIFTLFQLLPLPTVVLDLLSPFQYQTLEQSSGLLNIPLTGHPLSYVPLTSLSWWLFLFSLSLFFLLLKNHLNSQERIIRIAGLILVVALLESLYGLIQALIPSLGVLWVDHVTSYLGDARGTFINRNHFAGFLEMVWPVGLGMMFVMASRWRREIHFRTNLKSRFKNYLSSENIGIQLLLFTGMLIILLALLFSRSRAGITGAFIGFLSFITLIHLGRKRFSGFSWGIIGLGFCFLMIYGSLIGFDQVIGRFLLIEESTGGRLDIWNNTISIIKDHPFGIGLYNYKHVMPVYNASASLGIKYTHAHNDYLQLLAESGWPGFICLMTAFYFFLAKSIWRIRKFGNSIDTTRFYIGVGAVSGLVSIAFHSFYDFNLQIPANCLYFVVLIALVYGCVWGRASVKS